jgi:FAD/FMN-containing dehydrogenase
MIRSLELALRRLGPVTIKTDGLGRFSKPYNFPKKADAAAHVTVQNTDQISDVMEMARTHGIEIIPQGGNTSLVEGATPLASRQPVIILAVGDKSISISDDKKTMKIGAGTTLHEAQIAAKNADRHLSMTYGSRGTATLGGAIATRAMGMGQGIPQLTTAVTIVDGTGKVHSIRYAPDILFSTNSLLPGKGLTWPIANQGYLGVVADCTIKLDPPVLQAETVLVGGYSSESLISMVTQLNGYFHKIGSDAKLTIAEIMYRDALKNVFETHSDPFNGAVFPLYQLIQIATTSNDYDLKAVVIDGLATIQSHYSGCVIAQSQAQQDCLLLLRESISDSARTACDRLKLTPVPLDISCRIEQLPEVLQHLDRHTEGHRRHVFGHLSQGDGTHAVIHYNLGLTATTDHFEDELLGSLYSQFPTITHSGEHGGIGSKNIANTVKYAFPSDLGYFDQQCRLFNPYAVLQTSRLAYFRSLVDPIKL